MSVPRYESYRDSGVEWLGEIPAHWSVALSKRYFTVKSGDMISASDESDEGVPLIGGNGIRAYTAKANTPADTLVIGRVGALCGCVHHIRQPFWASEHAYCVIEKQPLSKRFFFHLLGAINLNRFAIKTAQPLLNTDIVETQWISVPPLDEQTAIAAFLDRETGRIDALVEAQRRLIGLLEEKRQAVISYAVTRGLDPAAPMKDCGVEWLGEVPAHWEVRKLLTALRSAPCYGVLVPDNDPDGVPMMRIMDMSDGRADPSEFSTISPALSQQYGRTILSVGDLALSVVGTIGTSLVADEALAGVNLSRAIARLQFNDDCSPHFARWLFESDAFRTFVDLVCVGSAQRVLNMDDLRAVRFPFPSPQEQAAICDYLCTAVAGLEALASQAAAAAVLLQERRAALISAAVTGKIDVRGLAPNHAEAA